LQNCTIRCTPVDIAQLHYLHINNPKMYTFFKDSVRTAQ